MILKLEDWPWAVVFLIHVHVLLCAFLITSWFSYVWHFRMGFETPYRVQAVLKMTSMNILVWKAFHPLILSAHRTVMEVLKQKIHLCFPALQRLLRIIPPLFTSPLGRVVWGVLEAKGGCPQDGKYSTLTCIWTTQETEKNYIYKQADTLSQSVTWNLGPVCKVRIIVSPWYFVLINQTILSTEYWFHVCGGKYGPSFEQPGHVF